MRATGAASDREQGVGPRRGDERVRARTARPLATGRVPAAALLSLSLLACPRAPREEASTATERGGAAIEPAPASDARGSSQAVHDSATAPALATVRGVAPLPSGGFPSVVLLEPEAAAAAVASPGGEKDAASAAESGARSGMSPFLDQIGSAFYPPVVLARAGEGVELLNSEGIMHNVHVADAAGETVLNLATPPGFAPYRHAFAAPGVYPVSCDIHPAMKGFIVVVATPWAAVADAAGRFTIAGVPPGTYRASVWNLDETRRPRRVVEIATSDVELDLSRTIE